MFLTLNHCFQLKYDSSVHNNVFSREKVVSSESGEKYAQIKHCFFFFFRWSTGFWCERTTGDGLFHQRTCYYWLWSYILARSGRLKLEAWICSWETRSFSLDKMLTDGLALCGLLVDYCDGFISCLDSLSDGTHSLLRIHWWASDAILNFSKSVHMKKQSHLHLGWPEGECIFSKFCKISTSQLVLV